MMGQMDLPPPTVVHIVNERPSDVGNNMVVQHSYGT